MDWKTAIPNAILRAILKHTPFAVVDQDGGLGSFWSIQDAVDAQKKVIWVREGTYVENIVIAATDAVRVLIGSGEGTVVSGGVAGHAVSSAKVGLILAFMSAQTTAGGGQAYDGFVFSGLRPICIGLNVVDSDQYAYSFTAGADNAILCACRSQGSDLQGISIPANADYIVIVACSIRGWTVAWLADAGTGTIAPTTANVTTA